MVGMGLHKRVRANFIIHAFLPFSNFNIIKHDYFKRIYHSISIFMAGTQRWNKKYRNMQYLEDTSISG